MAWVNPQVSCAVPTPIPMVTYTHDPCGFACQKQSKISQNGPELSELYGQTLPVHSFDHNSLNRQYLTILICYCIVCRGEELRN